MGQVAHAYPAVVDFLKCHNGTNHVRLSIAMTVDLYRPKFSLASGFARSIAIFHSRSLIESRLTPSLSVAIYTLAIGRHHLAGGFSVPRNSLLYFDLQEKNKLAQTPY